MTDAHRMQELTRGELAALAPEAVLVLPFGAVEQHGPGLPFGTDLLVVSAVAAAACERAAGAVPVVLAPALAYGSSDHHLEVGGALSLRWETFAACVADLLRSAAASGFRRVFAVNGHGGNDELLHVAAQAVARERGIEVAGGSYWTLAAPELARLAPEGAELPGHAGRFEASLVLALAGARSIPERDEVPPTAGPAPHWHESPERWRSIDGFTDEPAKGSAGDGAAYLDAIAGAVAASIRAFAGVPAVAA